MAKSKWRKRTFDTRLSFKQLCNRLGINVHQRLIMIRYMKQKMKGGNV